MIDGFGKFVLGETSEYVCSVVAPSAPVEEERLRWPRITWEEGGRRADSAEQSRKAFIVFVLHFGGPSPTATSRLLPMLGSVAVVDMHCYSEIIRRQTYRRAFLVYSSNLRREVSVASHPNSLACLWRDISAGHFVHN